MTTLVLAEHDNQRLNEATAKTVAAAQKLGGDVHVLVAGKGAAAVAAEAAKLAGVAKVLLAEVRCAGAWPRRAARGADRLARRALRRAGRADHRVGQERHAARRRAPRRDAGLRRDGGARPRHVPPPDLCRQRHPDGEVEGREEGPDHPHRLIPGGGGDRLGAGRERRAPLPIRASPPSKARASRRPSGRSSPRRRSSSRAGARSARRRNSWK